MGEARKWSWTEFAIGFLKKSFIVWVLSTVILVLLILYVLFLGDKDLDKIFYWIIAGGWLLFGIIFSLTNPIEKAIENAKVSLDLKATAQANTNAEISKILEVLKSKGA